MRLTIAANMGPLVAIRSQLEARVADAVQRTAEQIRDGAKERAPVDTGALRNSLRVEDGDSRLEKHVIAGGGTVDYASFIEFGTRRARAQPFLVPAAEAERPEFLARLKAAIEDRSL